MKAESQPFKELKMLITKLSQARLPEIVSKVPEFQTIWEDEAIKLVEGRGLKNLRKIKNKENRNPWAYSAANIWALCYLECLTDNEEVAELREKYEKLGKDEQQKISEPYKSIITDNHQELTAFLVKEPDWRPMIKTPKVFGNQREPANSHHYRDMHSFINQNPMPPLIEEEGWYVFKLQTNFAWGEKPEEFFNGSVYPIGKIYYRITTLRDNSEYEINVKGDDRETSSFIESQKKHLSLEDGKVEVEYEKKPQTLRLKLNIDPELLVDCKVELVHRTYGFEDETIDDTETRYAYENYAPTEGTLVDLEGTGLDGLEVKPFEYAQKKAIEIGGVQTSFIKSGKEIRLVPEEASKLPEKNIYDTVMDVARVKRELSGETDENAKSDLEREKQKLEADLDAYYSLAAGRIIYELREKHKPFLAEQKKVNEELLKEELTKDIKDRSILLRWLATKSHVDFNSHHWLFGEELDIEYGRLLKKPINEPDARVSTGWQNQIDDITAEVNMLLTGDNSKIKFIRPRPRSLYEIVKLPKFEQPVNKDEKPKEGKKVRMHTNEEIKKSDLDSLERDHKDLFDALVQSKEARKEAIVALDKANEATKRDKEKEEDFATRKAREVEKAKKSKLDAQVDIYVSIFRIWLLPNSPWKMKFLDEESDELVERYEARGQEETVNKIKNASDLQIRPANIEK